MELERLVRYVVGECEPQDKEDVERWMAADPAHAKRVDQLRTIWATADVARSEWDAEAAWTKVSRKLRPTPRRFAATLTKWRIAAAIAMVAGMSVLYRAGTLSRVVSGEHHTSHDKAVAREYVTHRGERAEFRLNDGTRVILGAASRLRVPSRYGVARRDVELDGLAYFEVQHDGARPFVVHTARGIAEDLGTRFDVLAYPGDTAMQVTVAEGKVALGADKQPGTVLLVAGQLGRLGASGKAVVHRDVDAASQLAWTDGRLVFTNVALRDALPQLSRWYDIDFRLSDTSIARRPLTATFRDRPTPEVLDLLALTLGVRLERRGGVVTLYAR